jgi:hypothetical protein
MDDLNLDYLKSRFTDHKGVLQSDDYGVVLSHVTKKDEKRPRRNIRVVVPEKDEKQEYIDKIQEYIDWENRFIKQQYIEWLDDKLVVEESHRSQTKKQRMSDIRQILEKFLSIITPLHI